MNYDLAIMALDGLVRAPMSVRVDGNTVIIEAEGASFKELARLCLLLGGAQSVADDAFELEPGVHVTKGSPTVKLMLPRT